MTRDKQGHAKLRVSASIVSPLIMTLRFSAQSCRGSAAWLLLLAIARHAFWRVPWPCNSPAVLLAQLLAFLKALRLIVKCQVLSLHVPSGHAVGAGACETKDENKSMYTLLECHVTRAGPCVGMRSSGGGAWGHGPKISNRVASSSRYHMYAYRTVLLLPCRNRLPCLAQLHCTWGDIWRHTN